MQAKQYVFTYQVNYICIANSSGQASVFVLVIFFGVQDQIISANLFMVLIRMMWAQHRSSITFRSLLRQKT